MTWLVNDYVTLSNSVAAEGMKTLAKLSWADLAASHREQAWVSC